MKLLFMGDSLIEYFDWQEGFPGHTVVNFGLAGESVEGLLSRVPGVKEACPQADAVFIMSGINNIAMGDEDFVDSYRSILEQLSSLYPDARIFVHSLLPTDTMFIANDSVHRANDRLRKLAEETGVNYLDLHARFVDGRGRTVAEYLGPDGVHLSRQGYEAWLSFLKELSFD